jgi:hypothetical protein
MTEYIVTTLAETATKDTDQITVVSASEITAGNPTTGEPPSYLYVDREFMKVKSVNGTTITVERGTLPGIVSGHAVGATVFAGKPEMWAYSDKAGFDIVAPQTRIINILNGEMFHNASGQWYGNRRITRSATLDFPSVASQTSADLTVAVDGAIVGDPVALGTPAAPAANIAFTAFVSAPNVVTVRCHNHSGAAVDPASGIFRVTVFK